MLQKNQILELFNILNEKLVAQNIDGEIYLLGGAVMCLAFNARPSTKDVDAFFLPKTKILALAKEIHLEKNLPEDWLNDAVKGFLSKDGECNPFLNLSSLKIFVAKPEYLLAMKCLSMRIGEEFHDEQDVRFLLRYLNIDSLQKALDIITKYYPLEIFPQKTLYVLEEILEIKS